jgi:hypothetical protein
VFIDNQVKIPGSTLIRQMLMKMLYSPVAVVLFALLLPLVWVLELLDRSSPTPNFSCCEDASIPYREICGGDHRTNSHQWDGLSGQNALFGNAAKTIPLLRKACLKFLWSSG